MVKTDVLKKDIEGTPIQNLKQLLNAVKKYHQKIMSKHEYPKYEY